MDNNIKKYRLKYKKCKWCKYYRYRSPSSKILGLMCPDYEECILKEKMLYHTGLFTFCKYYKLKEN